MPPADRAAAQRLASLGDRLQVQLRVLEESGSSVRVRVTAGPAADGDIHALAFLVIMEAARSAKEDLEAVMDSVREINQAKAGWRDTVPVQRPGDLDFEAIFHLVATLYAKQLEDELDELVNGEMGEMESLRLQMAMDRLSKLMSTLCNLLKKIADTNSQIVKNLE